MTNTNTQNQLYQQNCVRCGKVILMVLRSEFESAGPIKWVALDIEYDEESGETSAGEAHKCSMAGPALKERRGWRDLSKQRDLSKRKWELKFKN